MGLGHAVVIGGSVAGLTAARALSESFDRVTIVERDVLPDGPELRPGVPQGRQLHVLLPVGAEAMDEFFPGLTQELADLGCPTFDEVLDTPWFGAQGWRARRETDVKLIGFRRPLLEHVVRQRVRALANVEVLHGTVTGLLASEDASRITGVSYAAGDGKVTGVSELAGDLVVDASGRGSKTPRLLKGLGYEPPAEQHVRAYYGYASQFVRPRGPLPYGLQGVITMPFPGQTRGGCFLPSENGIWTLCAMGAMRDYPPADQDGFDQFVRDAATPIFAEMAAACDPVSDIVAYQHPGNQRRLWEQLDRRPRGFIPIGDAIASFNPIYGQGMSVATLQASKLRDRIASLGGDLETLPDAFMADVHEVIEFPFTLASNSDANYPGTTLANYDPPAPEAAAFFAAAEQAATEDPDIARDILHAAGWFQPEILASPELAAKVQAWVASGHEVTNNDPALVREPVTQPV
jgi:2-polyprenyl-6-methoxyphenol hydroxylase-like FAD-dependent oxidoreductase